MNCTKSLSVLVVEPEAEYTSLVQDPVLPLPDYTIIPFSIIRLRMAVLR